MSQARSYVFFFNDTATTEIYTLSLHDALPISPTPAPWPMKKTAPSPACAPQPSIAMAPSCFFPRARRGRGCFLRSEEHTSELQSHLNLVCRLLLEKKQRSIDPQPLNSLHYPVQ